MISERTVSVKRFMRPIRCQRAYRFQWIKSGELKAVNVGGEDQGKKTTLADHCRCPCDF